MTFNRYSLDLEASSSQYAYVADNAALSITGDISIEAWIKLEQLPSTFGTEFAIVSKYDTGANKRSYYFYIDTSNVLRVAYSSDGSSVTGIYTSSAAFTASDVGKWVHVAVAVDVSAETASIYKMGTSLATSVSAGAQTSIFNGDQNFGIGARFNSTTAVSFYDGLLSNVRVWSDIRSGAEILAGMYTTYTGTANNLVGSWYSTANNHNDLAGTNNLTSSGSPVFSTNVPWTGANSTDWTQVAKKIDHTKVSGSSNLTNFPVLIKDGNIPDAMYAGLQTTGADFRITTDSAGEVEVPFEIVAIDTTAKTCEIWAKIPTVSYTADTNLYIWYGNANAVVYDANAPFGSQNVWTNYSAVYHCNQGSNAQVIDSTANANNSSANTLDTTTGKIGSGFDNDNTEYATIPDHSSLNWSAITVSTWVYFDALNDGGIISKGFDGFYEYGIRVSTANDLQFYIDNDGTWGPIATSDSYSLTGKTGQWFLVQGIYTGTEIKMVVNGSEVGTANAYSSTILNSTGSLYLGAYGDATFNFDGQMDEARVRPSSVSVDWCTTEYNNQNSPSTFVIAASNAYTQECLDSVTLVDTIVKSTSRTLTDTATAVDSIIKSTSRSLLEEVSLLDTLIKGTGKTLEDSFSLVDSIVKSIGKTLSEEAYLIDSIIKWTDRNLTESVSLVDSITKIYDRIASGFARFMNVLSYKPNGFSKSKNEPSGFARDNNKPKGI